MASIFLTIFGIPLMNKDGSDSTHLAKIIFSQINLVRFIKAPSAMKVRMAATIRRNHEGLYVFMAYPLDHTYFIS